MAKGPSALRSILREADALRRQSVLLGRALRPRFVSGARRGDDVVLLLHGIGATAGVFEPLAERLAEAGVHHLGSFTYHPLRTVASLAQEVAAHVARVPDGARVHLVGHSLGGIVARYYVQELGGARRVTQTVSLASPFFGTTFVRAFPSALLPDLSPRSALLARLVDKKRVAAAGVPHVSFVAEADLLVTPPESAAFPVGEVVTVANAGHNGILFDEPTLARIVELVTARTTAKHAS